jgi:serine/threonine-protein kinase
MLTPNLRLLRRIGEGGMGSVWLAEHALLGAEVAVKLLSSELKSHPEALERFRNEATAVAQLKSPHVVRVHDFGEADGAPFMVMERLEGEDLHARLSRVRRLPLGIVTAIVVQTCKALSRVHELGIVHRDLKPGNIFLVQHDGELTVKLLDFGVAKIRRSRSVHETTDGAILGTPLYMSPEQVLSTKDVGPASDLYSLAVVIYECLAGEPPFPGDTMGAVHVKIAAGSYRPISQVDRTLPLTLDRFFQMALESDPQRRFGTAREMAEAFLEAARGSSAAFASAQSRPDTYPPGTTRPSVLTPFAPAGVPKPLSASAIAFAGALAIVAASFAGWGTYRVLRPSTPTVVAEGARLVPSASAAASADPEPATLTSATLTPIAPPSAAPPDSAPKPLPRPRAGWKPARKDRGF